MQVSLLPLAEQDLEAIYLYVQAGFSSHGAAWFSRLQQTIQSLSDTPLIGTQVPRRGGIYRLNYGKGRNVYLILYRLDLGSDSVQILRVLHGRTRRVANLVRSPR